MTLSQEKITSHSQKKGDIKTNGAKGRDSKIEILNNDGIKPIRKHFLDEKKLIYQ